MAFKINPITGKFNLWKSDKPSSWNANSNANDYTETGVYHFAGLRLNAQDNLPIDNVGENANIAFTLIVDRAKGYYNETETTINDIPGIISQTLFLGNRQGTETKIYVRNGNIQYSATDSDGVITWEAWKEQVGQTFLGVIRGTGYGMDGYNANETLKSCTENGLYTGAFLVGPQIFDTFKLEVMNNYAMAKVYSVANTVYQHLTILDIYGNDKVYARKGVWNGSAYDWGEWTNEETEIVAIENAAKQNELGLVKGGQNVFVNTDGSINVTQIINEIVDNYSDGVLSSLLLKINQNLTIEEAKHTYTDRGAQETVTDYAERQIYSVGYPDANNDYRHITAQEDLLPNTTKTVIDNIWLNALNLFYQLAQNEYRYYNYLQELRVGICRYPYYPGHYLFHIKFVNPTTTARVFLKNKFGEIMGEFDYINSYERELKMSYFTKDGAQCSDLSKILPFSIQVTSGNELYTYDGLEFIIRTWQKGISGEVYDENNSRYLYGYFQKSVITENAYQDYTKNIAICSDGLLIQGRNQHLYFRVNDEGNIETNINEIL